MADHAINNDYKYIRTVLIPFMKDNGDKRVSSETMNHYKLFTIQRSTIDEVVIAEVVEDNYIKSISVATIRNGSHVTHSTTVTSKDCRNKGYGTQALKAKILALKEKGMGIKTVIAEDNIPAMKICKKTDLKIVETRQRTRSTGPFNAVIWMDPEKPLDPPDEIEGQ